MKKVLINYANDKFKYSQKKNSKSGLKKGKFDQVIEYSPKDIDENFYKKNKNILKAIRGGGYWLWKPYIILKTLKRNDIKNGEYIFYCDSGSRFFSSIDPIIAKLNSLKQDILGFQLEEQHPEKRWTKRDIFVKLKADSKKYSESNQIAATNILMKKTSFSIKFFEEVLQYAQIKHLIDDTPSKMKNYKIFTENRHDQSIFSILYKKHNLKSVPLQNYEINIENLHNQDLFSILYNTVELNVYIIFSVLYKKYYLKPVSFENYKDKIIANLRISYRSLPEKLKSFIKRRLLIIKNYLFKSN